MLIILPINSKLTANQIYGTHWTKTSALKKQAKNFGYYAALETINKNPVDFTELDKLQLNIKVYYKNENHLDDDNLLYSIKSYRDGVFELLKIKIGAKINDKQIVLTILDTGNIDKNNPRIEWELLKKDF